jgi:hypothetical protein
MRHQHRALPFIAAILSLNAYPCQRVTPVSSMDMISQANVILRVSALEYAVEPGNPNVLTTGVPDSINSANAPSIEIDRSTGLVRRWLQYAFYGWTREMPKSVAEKDKELI